MPSNEMAMEALKWIASTMQENYEEAKKDSEEHSDDKFTLGRKQAYWEMLDSLQSRLEILDVPVEIPAPKAV